MSRIATYALLLIVAGCGKQEALRPAAGQSLPPKPLMAREALSPDQLLTPDSEARPTRNVEAIRRSSPRPDDPFDLPPK